MQCTQQFQWRQTQVTSSVGVNWEKRMLQPTIHRDQPSWSWRWLHYFFYSPWDQLHGLRLATDSWLLIMNTRKFTESDVTVQFCITPNNKSHSLILQPSMIMKEIQRYCRPGLWWQEAYLNMSDPSQQCPGASVLLPGESVTPGSGVRACGRQIVQQQLTSLAISTAEYVEGLLTINLGLQMVLMRSALMALALLMVRDYDFRNNRWLFKHKHNWE